jgi:hypothetical protein
MYSGATISAQTWDVLCGSMWKGPQTTSKQWSPPMKGNTIMTCPRLGMVVRIWQVLQEVRIQVQLCHCRIKGDGLVDQCLLGMALTVQGGQKWVLVWAKGAVVCPWERIHWMMIRCTIHLRWPWAYHHHCHATMVSIGTRIHKQLKIFGLNLCQDQSRSKPSWVPGRRTSIQTLINKTWPMLVWVDVDSSHFTFSSFIYFWYKISQTQ